ncbi:MAG TPA: rhomboid family intramembrane serine protease [Polyangia bacterium]|jgi:membrane associated rhomboid family serine protease|nr:rhomboid family intramembrane serine protease [Polyangia bacterium]
MPKSPRSGGRRAPWMDTVASRMTPAIKALVIANTAVYLMYVFVKEIRPVMLEHLAVGESMLHEPWQPITAMFVHFDPLSFILNLVGLWFVGAFIERTQGTRRFLTLFFGAGILANVAIGLVASVYGARGVYAGTSGAVLALFVAFARIYGPAPTQVLGSLYLKAHHLAMIFVGWAIVADLLRRDLASLAGTLVVTAVGYVLAAPGGLREAYDTFRARRLRQRYKVIDGGVPGRAKGTRSHKYWN